MGAEFAAGPKAGQWSRSACGNRQEGGRPGTSGALQQYLYAATAHSTPTGARPPGWRRAAGATSGAAAVRVVCRARQGVRQPVLGGPDGIHGVGRHDVRGDHRDRSAVRVFGRGGSGERAHQARTRSEEYSLRRRQPCASGSRRGSGAAAGARCARRDERSRLGLSGYRPWPLAEGQEGHRGDRRLQADARRHDTHAASHARTYARDDLHHHSREGRQQPSCGNAVGWNGLQLAQRISSIHSTQHAGDLLV